jgi:hypothetical protein
MNWRLIEWGLPLGVFCWLFVQMWTETPAGSAARGRHARRFPRRRDRPSSATDEASEPSSVPNPGNPPSNQAPSP